MNGHSHQNNYVITLFVFLGFFFQFINDRLVMLNSGRGFTDIFEQECLIHADKLNAQSRYKEWLHNMKVKDFSYIMGKESLCPMQVTKVQASICILTVWPGFLFIYLFFFTFIIYN